MRKVKKKLKKEKQEQRQAFRQLKEITRRFSVEQWLRLIRTVDMKNLGTIENYSFKGEFLVLVADRALRFSKSDPEKSYPKPNSDDLKNIISLYLKCDQSPIKLLEELGIVALPLIAKWQNRFDYPPTNAIRRMLLLYDDYEDDILKMIGITILDLHIITLVVYGLYADQKSMYFSAELLYSPTVSSLSRDKIKKFLDFFAVDAENYHKKAKSLGIYDNQVTTFNLMNRYPIIKIDTDLYITPSKDQLIDSVAANLYFHILDHKQTQGSDKSKEYLDGFGLTLQEYVIDLAKFVFKEESVIDADDIVTNANHLRCEAVCQYKNKSLAIEVKKLNFQRDTLLNADTRDIKHIEDRFIDSLVKARNQIISTLRYLEGDKYGLIVIPDILLPSSILLDYIKQNSSEDNTKFEKNILICTLSEYEQLMANSCETIFSALEMAMESSAQEPDAISLVLGSMKENGETVGIINPYLEQIAEEKIREQEV